MKDREIYCCHFGIGVIFWVSMCISISILQSGCFLVNLSVSGANTSSSKLSCPVTAFVSHARTDMCISFITVIMHVIR